MENSCKVIRKPKSVKEFFTSWYFWKPFTGVFTGVLAGLLYFHFIECPACSWSVISDTYNYMFFGGFLGFFVTVSPCSRFGR